MKKKATILSLIIISLFSLTAKAQDDAPQARSYLSFFGGLSLPMGSYGSSTFTDNSAGFAHKGQVYGADINIIAHKNLGIGITLGVQDQGELTTAQAQLLTNGYNATSDKNQTSFSATGRFSNMVLMAGPNYTFLLKKFALDLRASAGMIKSFTTPAETLVLAYNPETSGQTYVQISSKAVALAYGFTVNLRYELSDSWDVGVKLNYIGSPGLKINNSAGDAATIGRFQTNMPVNLVQTALAFTLKF